MRILKQIRVNWTNGLVLLCRQSALSRSLHFSWHFTPHSVQRTPCRAIPQSKPRKTFHFRYVARKEIHAYSYITFTFVAIGWRCCVVRGEVVWGCRWNRIDKRLERLFVNVCFLDGQKLIKISWNCAFCYSFIMLTRSSSFNVGLGIADVRPAFRLVAAIVCHNILWESLESFHLSRFNNETSNKLV